MTPPIAGPSQGLNAAVAAELRAAQGRRKLSVAALSELAEIPYGTLRRYLAAERHIDVATLDQLAAVLGTSAQAVVAAAADQMIRESQQGGRVYEFPTQSAAAPTVTEEDLIGEPSVAEPQREDHEGEADPEDA